jgi:hypothetical protein
MLLSCGIATAALIGYRPWNSGARILVGIVFLLACGIWCPFHRAVPAEPPARLAR